MEATFFLCHGRSPFLVADCPSFDETRHFADNNAMSSEPTVPQ